MTNPFKRSTARILGLFGLIVKQLAAHAAAEQKKAEKLDRRIIELSAKHRAAWDEVDAAEAAALNIKKLIGGAA